MPITLGLLLVYILVDDDFDKANKDKICNNEANHGSVYDTLN